MFLVILLAVLFTTCPTGLMSFGQVFHEGSFRQRYATLITSAYVAGPDNNFLWLLMLVLALGAHYSSLREPLDEHHRNLSVLSETLLTQIEYRFLQIIGCPNVEAVQVCVLMGSFHLFNGRPTVGMGVLGSGIKIAQVIGLHREAMWHNLSEVARESRRRSWWALEVFDKYVTCSSSHLSCFLSDFIVSFPGMQLWPLGGHVV